MWYLYKLTFALRDSNTSFFFLLFPPYSGETNLCARSAHCVLLLSTAIVYLSVSLCGLGMSA